MAESPPPRISPVDVGPWITLPTGRLLGAMALGAAFAGAVGGLAVWFLKPGSVSAAGWAMAAAVASHLVSITMIQPWKPRFLGQWPFAVLRASAVSILLILVFLVLIYSAARPDPAVLGLMAVGAWFVGLLSLVSAYGSYIRGLPAEVAPVR